MTTVAGSNPLEAFQWQQQPQAEKLVRRLVGEFVEKNSFARMFAQKLHDEAGVRFVDMVDTIWVPSRDTTRDELTAAGFRAQTNSGWYTHSGGMFPSISLAVDEKERQTWIFMKVEFVDDFMAAWGVPSTEILEGCPTSPLRSVFASKEPETVLVAVERHGFRGQHAPKKWDKTGDVLYHREQFRLRRRNLDNDADGFAEAHRRIDAAIEDLGVDYTCDLFFAAEREYWMRRNHAARVQKARQDRLGIGWANHDHHTYRSSREHFASLVGVHEKLGLVCRERFYAGREAGWGAQVMEQPVTGIITFNDVDLSPEELMGDFSHDGLSPRDKLGTVGLWCALHGEAILEAGMHHLEAQFDFDALRDQLASDGVKIMKPFTNFTFLRQAFTEGERWQVDPKRIDRALQRGYITQEQAKQFREQGAIGSHLENLERNEGFKGFNQTGVSEIISATDPRKQLKTAVGN